jgi:hypothetical protein
LRSGLEPIHSTAPMLRRVLRAALFASLVLAFWTVSRPAFAMPAGFCDDRGASAIAPPPSLEASDEAIARARLPAMCRGAELPIRATIVPFHHGFPVASASADYALPLRVTPVAAARGDLLELTYDGNRPSSGVRWRIERPPRG